MHIAADPHNLPLAPRALARGCAVTVGNFDGVHLGHQVLIKAMVEKARNSGLPAVVITFDPHPVRLFMGDAALPKLMSLHHKMECFSLLGVDLALVMPFTKETAAVTPEAFIEDVLVRSLNTRELVVGYDYTFGARRRGNAAMLTEFGKRYGYAAEQIVPVVLRGDVVSSTRIRKALQAGDVEEAARLLGRPHTVEGVIVHGMNRGGRLLGFPTANLQADDDLLLPCPGVYAVLAELDPGHAADRLTLPAVLPENDGRLLKGVANVGKNPTFGDESLRVETYLLDFHRDIYGCRFRVHFIRRLRDERKFAGVTELAEQIQKDAASARAVLSSPSSF